MAVPILHLNLAPRPSLWRQRHLLLGWLSLGIGIAVLVGTIAMTWRAYHQANSAGRAAVSLTAEAKRAARQEQQIQASLQDMDATREQSRWKLAERILQERSLPWSRLTAELEQTMVPDMRLKGLQRARSNSQQVVLKLKAEARTREAEAAFVEALRATPVFAQVILERESESQSGGLEFECVLPAVSLPAPYESLPKFGPARASTQTSAPPPSVQQKPVPQRMTPPVNRSAPVAAPPPMVTRPTPMQPHPGTPPNSPTYRPNMPPIHRQFPNSAPPQGERQ